MKMFYSLESGRHLFNSTSDSLFILILDSCIQLLFNTFNLFCQLISNLRCLSISTLSILVCSLNLGVCSYWCGLSNWCCCYGRRCRDCKCRRCCIQKFWNILVDEHLLCQNSIFEYTKHLSKPLPLAGWATRGAALMAGCWACACCT